MEQFIRQQKLIQHISESVSFLGAGWALTDSSKRSSFMAHVIIAQQDFSKQQKLGVARESKQLWKRKVKDGGEAAPKTENPSSLCLESREK